MPGRYHPDPLSLSHGLTMGRWTYESLSHYGDSDSKRYHHFEKNQPFYKKKSEKRKPAKMDSPASNAKRDSGIRSYFVLTGLDSFTTSRTGYSESESGTLYMAPVRIAGASSRTMSAGWAT